MRFAGFTRFDALVLRLQKLSAILRYRDDGQATAVRRSSGPGMLGLTPLSQAYSSLPYAARHSHSASFPITSPTSSRTADQTSAETKLAIWNGQ